MRKSFPLYGVLLLLLIGTANAQSFEQLTTPSRCRKATLSNCTKATPSKATPSAISKATPSTIKQPASASSNWVGIKGGSSISRINGGSDGYSSRLAGNFGILSEFGLHNNLSLQTELNYSGQGGKREGMQPITNLSSGFEGIVQPGNDLYADIKNVLVLNYLELPVMAKLTWGKKFPFYVNAGPYVAYLVNAKAKTSGTSTIYVNKKGDPLTIQGQPLPQQSFDGCTDVTSSFNRFNVGITGGAGVIWPISAASRLFLDARFAYGFLDVLKNSEVGCSKTANALFSVGYAHRLPVCAKKRAPVEGSK